MTQPRIFVSYVPERTLAAARPSRAREPMVAVLAGALLAGGGMHTVGRGESGENRPAVGPQTATTHFRVGPAPLPHLALASVARVEKQASPQLRSLAPPPVAKSVSPPPVTSPRRDLAGFLEDRGLALAAPKPEIAADRDAVSATPAPSAVATALSVPDGGSEEVPGGATTAQTFPMVYVADRELGAVTMRGDKVHLASLVGLLELKLPAAEFDRLSSAPAADSFVTIESLREAGIDVALDAGGERISLSAS